MSNYNTNNTLLLFSSPQKTEEGYTSLENHRYYMAALAILVSQEMQKHLSQMSLFVQLRIFQNLQEKVGGGFPYQRRINSRLPQRSGSSMTRVNYMTTERPDEYKKVTEWYSEAVNKSLWEVTVANPQADAETDAEFFRIMASFVKCLFQDCICELALSTQRRHLPKYPTDLVASWLVEHVRNVNRFSGRGEEPSNGLVDLINAVTPEIASEGVLLLGHERALANFNLKTQTKYENALELLVEKMQTDQVIPFNYGFLESGSFMVTSRFPSALVNNIPTKKFMSYLVISPIALIPFAEFSAGDVLVPGARGNGFYKVTKPTTLAAGEYVLVRLHEICLRGETLICTVLATNEYQKPVMAYVTTIQEHNNTYAQGGNEEWVLRQAVCVGVAGHESIRTCPAASAVECEYPDANNPPTWQTKGVNAEKNLPPKIITATEMNELKMTPYYNDNVFFKHSLDVYPGVQAKLFSGGINATDDARYSSLTDTELKNEYCHKGLDDVPCNLVYHSGNFLNVRVPYIVKVGGDYKVEPINPGLLQVLAGKPTTPVSEIFTPSFQFTPVSY